MYHSHLLINVGDNPDRPDWAIGRRWLRNLYRVHQRLCMAFPSKPLPAEKRIAAYCRSYAEAVAPLQRDLSGQPDDHGPADDEPAQVQAPRDPKAGFLFRIDHPPDPMGKPGRRPVIIVQSNGDHPPDWDYAFGLTPGALDDHGRPIGNAGYLLAAQPQAREVSIETDGNALVLDSPEQRQMLHPGERVRFRVRANATRKVNGKRQRLDPRPDSILQAHTDWLARKLAPAGELEKPLPTVVPGWAYGWRTKHEPQPNQRMQFWSVLFEGIFVLENPAMLRDLLLTGIGPAKAFGFGLLSLAPL